MTTIDELKKQWNEGQDAPDTQAYDQASLEKIFKSRVINHMRAAMQYFWASFVLQIVVYALLSHVMVKYGSDSEMLGFSIAGILLFLPFTILLMKKFKSIAGTKLTEGNNAQMSIYDYIRRHHALLLSFYQFKKWYEFVLIPLSCAIGVILTFNLYVPGGVSEHYAGAGITFIIALSSCVVAIRSENKRSFEQPLLHLGRILEEFKNEAV